MQRIYTFTVRVPYAHTDQMKFVYYANYLVYFEMARTDMLRQAGMPYTRMEAEGVLLPVLEAHCVYHKPAHYDDLLTIETQCRLDGPRLRIDYRVLRDGDLLATGNTVHVCMTPAGRPIRPPEALRALGTHA